MFCKVGAHQGRLGHGAIEIIFSPPAHPQDLSRSIVHSLQVRNRVLLSLIKKGQPLEMA
jgi:hypothetical protein